MLDQPDKATLPAYGVPGTSINELDTKRLLESVTEEERTRIESSMEDKFYVFPISPSMYRVYSVDDGQIENQYRVNLRSHSVCSCYDYLYRCSRNGYYCKHIWRVRMLIKLGSLPATDDDPYTWLISELHKDKKWLKNNVSQPEKLTQELNSIENKLTNQGRDGADYKIIMQERADVMMQSMAQSL